MKLVRMTLQTVFLTHKVYDTSKCSAYWATVGVGAVVGQIFIWADNKYGLSLYS